MSGSKGLGFRVSGVGSKAWSSGEEGEKGRVTCAVRGTDKQRPGSPLGGLRLFRCLKFWRET